MHFIAKNILSVHKHNFTYFLYFSTPHALPPLLMPYPYSPCPAPTPHVLPPLLMPYPYSPCPTPTPHALPPLLMPHPHSSCPTPIRHTLPPPIPHGAAPPPRHTSNLHLFIITCQFLTFMTFPVRGMWLNKPDGYPPHVPYFDPNNPAQDGTAKPKKQDILPMFNHLLKVYRVSKTNNVTLITF